MAYASSVDGISAVNPQAKGNYQDYINASFNNAKNRLDPIFGQQNAAYEQQMVNRGLPVGGDAYNSSFQQLQQNQNDAYSGAAFDAMGFGLGAQAQDFGQDATRSQLANALLQAQWNDQTNRFNINTNADLGYARIGEDARQFDDTLAQRGYEFDTNTDYNYWDRGNYYDLAWDRAAQSDYQYAQDFDRAVWNDQVANNQFSDKLGMMNLNPFLPNLPNVGQPLVSGQNSNLIGYGQNYGNYSDYWNNVGQFLGEIDWDKLFSSGS